MSFRSLPPGPSHNVSEGPLTRVILLTNDIGMSRQMVDHYMRFKDQMGVAAGGQRRLKLVTRE